MSHGKKHDDEANVTDQVTAPREIGVDVATFEVEAESGPKAGTRWTIDAGSTVLVGKSHVCEICLDDARVSRRHATLEPRGAELVVTDTESTNGVFVGSVRVGKAWLANGDRVRVGDTTLVVRVTSAPRSVRLSAKTGFGRLVGESVAMRRLYPMLRKLAAADVPVVIEGETGTGKEVLAESLHDKGPRANGPFVVFDCTTVASTLLEAALFGHERGAFTGATQRRAGVFEQADGGTLFLDEIGDLDLALQAKLLRALERREVQRVGGEKWIKVDVRILAATRRNLDDAVAKGQFRDDLFFRLAVARVELPPLRARTGDIGLLAAHFWRSLGGEGMLPEDLRRDLERSTWPGNVRELHNAVARHLALGDLATEAPRPTAAHADTIERILALDLPFARARERLVEEFAQRYVDRVVAAHDGNVTRAAAAAGLGRRYLQMLRARRREG
jgi:DNA-binding NtrC family response regulator